MVPKLGVGQFRGDDLATGAPHRDGLRESTDVVDAADPDFPTRSFALNSAAINDAGPLRPRVVDLDRTANAPTQKEPMKLAGQLLRGGGEAKPYPAGLFPAHPAIGFEDAEHQVRHDISRYIFCEE